MVLEHARIVEDEGYEELALRPLGRGDKLKGRDLMVRGRDRCVEVVRSSGVTSYRLYVNDWDLKDKYVKLTLAKLEGGREVSAKESKLPLDWPSHFVGTFIDVSAYCGHRPGRGNQLHLVVNVPLGIEVSNPL